MKYTRHLKASQLQSLKYETVSSELKVYLTRILSEQLADSEDDSVDVALIRKNEVINMSLNIQGKPIFVLEGDDWGHFEPPIHAWNNGEFHLIFRRLDTPQFIEFLGDLIEREYFAIKQINALLEKEGSSFRYAYKNAGTSTELRVDVLSIKEMEDLIEAANSESDGPAPHDNIRVLISRAEDALARKDAAGVLHTCASIFETLAKDIIGDPKIENQPLGGFFAKYRKNSSLPDSVLDYIQEQYNKRNTLPIAGHGSTLTPPTMTEKEMVTLIEMTKAFVIVEYRLAIQAQKSGVKK